MNPIQYRDLYEFRFLSGLEPAPDGAHAVFSVHRASEEKNGYVTDLWLLNTADDSVRQLTCGGEASAAFWLDPRTVAFSAKRGEKKAWYRIAIDGGEAEEFLQFEETVSALKPIRGGFAASFSRHCEGKEEEKPHEALDGRDLWVFDEIPFWYDGQGRKNKIRQGIMLVRGEERTVITAPYFKVTGMAVSPDGSKIAYAGAEFRDMLVRPTGLYLYDIDSGETKTLVEPGQQRVGNLCFFDDDALFFTGTTFEFSGRNGRYFRCDLPDGSITELPFPDADPDGSVSSDASYGGGATLRQHGGKLYFPLLRGSRVQPVCMDKDGVITPIAEPEGTIGSLAVCGDRLLMMAMRGTKLTELWSMDLATGEARQLTDFNGGYLRAHDVAEPEYFTFTNSDGWELEGYVLKPRGYEPGKQYPAIFEMHGGPKVAFGGLFHHEMQCFASQGYFVFYTNPRGSDGRGEDFANITEQLGGIDYQDFMEFCDEVLRRQPDIDPKRVAICGGSYAGFMCNWMIGHTDRFAAAASQRSISNYLTKALCTDIGFNHNMAQLGTNPWEDFDTVWAHSPLKYAPNAKTPTLFIHSDEDYRCWMSDAFQLFTALKMNGVESRICLFHGESHGLSRIGKPENRISRLTEIGDWFRRFLKP